MSQAAPLAALMATFLTSGQATSQIASQAAPLDAFTAASLVETQDASLAASLAAFMAGPPARNAAVAHLSGSALNELKISSMSAALGR